MHALHFICLTFWAIFASQYLVLVSIAWESTDWGVLFCFFALFCFFSVVFCLLSKTALTQMCVWVCMHACVLTTDMSTPWYKTWFCCYCFVLWPCDKWLEFSEALGLHAVYAIHLGLQDKIPFCHSTWWDSVHCPTVGPSWVKLKADRLGAKDPWCGEAISLSSRLWNQYQRDAGPGVGKSWTAPSFLSHGCTPEGLSGCALEH